MPAKLVLLKTAADFEKFRDSRSYFSPLLRLRVAPPSQNHPRFGFIIPKKVVARVHERNKLKRRLKNILLKNLTHLQAKDVLMFPKKDALYKPFGELEAEVVKLLKQAKLWKV